MSGPWEQYGQSTGPWAQYNAPPNVLSDVGQSIAPGLGEGVAAPLGSIGEAITNIAAPGVNLALKETGQPSLTQRLIQLAHGVTGDYKPKTTAGEYTKTIASFAPAAVMGPEGLVPKIASAVIPAVTSETAGQVTKGTPYENVARLLGALAGGPLAGLRYEGLPSAAKVNAALPGMTPQDVTATRYIAGLLQKDKATPQSVASFESSSFGKPVTAAQASGNTAVTHLAALARREGETGNLVGADVTARQIGAPQRLLNDFAATAGIKPEAAQGNIEALVKAGRQQAAPLYEQAYNAHPLNPDHIEAGGTLDALMDRPSMVKAAQNALKIAAEEGRNPASLGITFNPAGDVKFEQVPSWQTLDYLKRGLDDHLESLRDSVTGKLPNDASTHATQDTRSTFRSFLKDENPAYGKALDTSSDYLSAQQAFKNGQDWLFNNNVTAKQAADMFSALSQPEKQSVIGGMANKIFNLQQAGRLKPNILNSPIVKSKLTSVLGQDRANALIARANVESGIAKTDARIAPGGGSPTMPLSSAAAAQDAFSGGNELADALSDFARTRSFTGTATNIVGRKAQGAIDYLRTQGMPVDVRDAAGKALAGSPQDLIAILQRVQTAKMLKAPGIGYISPTGTQLLGQSAVAGGQ